MSAAISTSIRIIRFAMCPSFDPITPSAVIAATKPTRAACSAALLGLPIRAWAGLKGLRYMLNTRGLPIRAWAGLNGLRDMPRGW
jgi:hypothetical protein